MAQWRAADIPGHPLLLCLSVLLLAGCGKQGETPEQVMAKAKAENRLVLCRLQDASAFRADCILETHGKDRQGARLLVLRHRDGGFRRLALSADGSLSEADGAEPLRLEKDAGDSLYVSLGADHYRLRLDQLDAAQ